MIGACHLVMMSAIVSVPSEFYLDPRHYGLKVYRYTLEADEFEKMAGILARVKGKFLMSLNDHPDMRGMFKDFRI